MKGLLFVDSISNHSSAAHIIYLIWQSLCFKSFRWRFMLIQPEAYCDEWRVILVGIKDFHIDNHTKLNFPKNEFWCINSESRQIGFNILLHRRSVFFFLSRRRDLGQRFLYAETYGSRIYLLTRKKYIYPWWNQEISYILRMRVRGFFFHSFFYGWAVKKKKNKKINQYFHACEFLIQELMNELKDFRLVSTISKYM